MNTKKTSMHSFVRSFLSQKEANACTFYAGELSIDSDENVIECEWKTGGGCHFGLLICCYIVVAAHFCLQFPVHFISYQFRKLTKNCVIQYNVLYMRVCVSFRFRFRFWLQVIFFSAVLILFWHSIAFKMHIFLEVCTSIKNEMKLIVTEPSKMKEENNEKKKQHRIWNTK